MPLYRLTASADTTITNGFKQDTTVRAEYANMGAADSLEIYSLYFKEGSTENSQKNRILINFPLQKIQELRDNMKLPGAGNVSFFLNLYNVEHPYTIPAGFDLLIKPISGSWQEGKGLDLDDYSDSGVVATSGNGANWVYRGMGEDHTGSLWSIEGGDFYDNYDCFAHFEAGYEDLSVDVTGIVEAQLTGELSADGMGIMLASLFENLTSTESYYTKRFSARSTEYFFSRPVLEVRWEADANDDRSAFNLYTPALEEVDNSGSIYFYNRYSGILKNLPNDTVPNVVITKSETTGAIASGSAEQVDVGIYKFTFCVTGSEEFEGIDVWKSGSAVYHTGQINFQTRKNEEAGEFIFNITNLKPSYQQKESAILKIYSRNKDWSPTIYTVASKTIENIFHKNLYFKVFRVEDSKVIIDYGIDPIAYTKCGYDVDGNYLQLDMSMFEPDYMYGIMLATVTDGQITEYNKVFKFRVT